MSQKQIEDNKKPYETPVLTNLGKVEDVTQGTQPLISDAITLGSQ